MKMLNPQKHRAYQRYKEFNKTYPNIKKLYKGIDNWYFNNKQERINGVYATLNATLAVAGDYFVSRFGIPKPKHLHEVNEQERQAQMFLNAMPMFASWRMSLSIYRIDENIFEEMLKAPIPTDTPSDIFRKLPDFCVYIEFPRIIRTSELLKTETIDKRVLDLEIAGFWAYINHTATDANKIELKICADVIENKHYLETFPAVSMVIEDGLTVEQSADLVFEQYTGMSKERATMLAENDKKALFGYLPMLLWLCAEEPDISNMVGEPLTTEQVKQPKYSQKKKTGQFIPPSNPRIYHLGSRLGGEIRQFQDEIKRSDSTKRSSSKRPHIRKGHYHGYWIGSGQDKQFIVKWLSATFVNAP